MRRREENQRGKKKKAFLFTSLFWINAIKLAAIILLTSTLKMRKTSLVTPAFSGLCLAVAKVHPFAFCVKGMRLLQLLLLKQQLLLLRLYRSTFLLLKKTEAMHDKVYHICSRVPCCGQTSEQSCNLERRTPTNESTAGST